MKILVVAIALFCLYNIFIRKGVNRFLWFLGAISFFHERVVPWGDYHKLACSIYFMACMVEWKSFKESLKQFPFKWLILLLLMLHILNAVYNPYLSLPKALFLSFTSYLVSFGIFVMSYYSISQEKDIDIIYERLYLYILVVSGCGFFFKIIGYNPIMIIEDCSHIGMYSGKISAFQLSPNTHILSIMFPLFVVLRSIPMRNALLIFILLLCNIIFSTHRFPFVDLAFAFLLIIILSPIMAQKKYKIYRNILAILVVGIFGIFVLGSLGILKIDDKIERFTNAAQTDDRNVSGSSLAMRLDQIEVAKVYYNERPAWGHGIGYYNAFLQKGDDKMGLLGMESIILWLLVEYGLYLIVAIIALVISILFYFIKVRLKYDEKETTTVGLVILLVFVLHELLNRPWGIFEIAFSMMAICVRKIEFMEQSGLLVKK